MRAKARCDIDRRTIGEDTVLTKPESNLLYILNDVGGFVWGCIQELTTVEEICDKIQREFLDVDQQTLYDDVLCIIEEMSQKELIVVEHDK